MNLILLGAPGSGKGTQAKALAERLKLAHLSTGDVFREEISKKTPLGQKVSGYVTSGKLVPDAVVTEVVTARLAGLNAGFLLDGFPRTVEQAMSLDSYLKKAGKTIDRVVYLNLSEEEVLKRLTARRNCASCGELYNMISKPPKHAQFCDKCGGKLVQRDDDKEETVKRRLMVFRDLTEPLISYYKTNEALFEADGAGSPESITDSILGELGQGSAAA
jgi:adenylate kinase